MSLATTEFADDLSRAHIPAIATLASPRSLVSTATAMAGGAAGATRLSPGSDGGPIGYFVDSLFRRDPAAAGATPSGSAGTGEALERSSTRDAAEVSRIFLNVSRTEPLPPADIRYVGQIVAQRTGLSQQDAEKRVSDV